MNRYEVLEKLGGGSFGEVVKARSLKTGEIVAIKKIKKIFPTWEECLQLRELKSLKVLRHENIVQLKEVIRDKEELYFVFEHMESNLYELMEKYEEPFTESQISSIMYQLFSSLAYMHKHGFFHRDIKPENLLCQGDLVKLADFGQAREVRSRPPYTDYVSTRWYRSPELLLRSTTYNSPIDLWACGCIMAELYMGQNIFAGTSEPDQLCRICQVLGTPTKDSWSDGINMVSKMQFKFPKCSPVSLKSLIPNASSAAIQLIHDLLQYDPNRRPTAAQALQYKYFSNFENDGEYQTKISLQRSKSNVIPTPIPVTSIPKIQPLCMDLDTKISIEDLLDAEERKLEMSARRSSQTESTKSNLSTPEVYESHESATSTLNGSVNEDMLQDLLDQVMS